MRRVYFAGPLFSETELRFNEELASKIEDLGLKVYLPQRDGAPTKPNYKKLSPKKKREAIFRSDSKNVVRSDIFLFILDGRVPDEGACVELGIAYQDKMIKKKERFIVGLHTDRRIAFAASKLNPMVAVPFDFIAETEEELLGYLSKRLR